MDVNVDSKKCGYVAEKIARNFDGKDSVFMATALAACMGKILNDCAIEMDIDLQDIADDFTDMFKESLDRTCEEYIKQNPDKSEKPKGKRVEMNINIIENKGNVVMGNFGEAHDITDEEAEEYKQIIVGIIAPIVSLDFPLASYLLAAASASLFAIHRDSRGKEPCGGIKEYARIMAKSTEDFIPAINLIPIDK